MKSFVTKLEKIDEKFRDEIGNVGVENNAEAWKLATDGIRFWPEFSAIAFARSERQ